MADLQSDILGQVARLPLRPSEANALLPLYEAVSNSLHAIQEQFGDAKVVQSGRIDIEVLRTDINDSPNSVVGFKIIDNGIGLNTANYTSFLTPFSQHKIAKGGKGIGRLGWLKIFEKIRIESQYSDNGSLCVRDFDFMLRERDQISPSNGRAANGDGPGTTVYLREFQSSFLEL